MKNRTLLLILSSCVLLVLGVIYIVKGVRLWVDADILAASIEESRLYFELGFNSTAHWKKAYLFQSYMRIGGGVIIFLSGLFLIFKCRSVSNKVLE